ncbi:MAG: restriction endonuclease subunit S [Aeriscardovia sp.]|nr:restriction endonuclease subunit S [Aeriscardovia sp.]
MALCVVLVSLAKGTLARGQLLSDGLYPVMNSGRDFYGWYDSKNNSGNAITIAARGEYAGYVNYIERDFWAGGLCYPYRSANEDFALTKYVYHVLKNDEQHMMDSLVARGSIPALNKKDLEKLRIPVPPLEVQRRIVRVLDEYTAAHDELVRKLEEEMALREQQLSLVRNQLLTFTEKAA